MAIRKLDEPSMEYRVPHATPKSVTEIPSTTPQGMDRMLIESIGHMAYQSEDADRAIAQKKKTVLPMDIR